MSRPKPPPWLGLAKKLHRSTRSRTKIRGLELSPDLSVDWIYQTIKDQDYRCFQTNIEFSLEVHSPWRPSLDRIDSLQGYTPANVQIVTWMYNNAKRAWTEETLLIFANAVVDHSLLGASSQ